jgi:HPr kinase/phosphorylase
MVTSGRIVHGSCAAWKDEGALLLGPSGSGKSDLLLRLLGLGWRLVADDQLQLSVSADALWAEAPPSLAGMIEVRGLGLLSGLPHAPTRLAFAAELGPGPARLPEPRRFEFEGLYLPALRLDPFEASAPDKLRSALDVLGGRIGMRAGAFAA